MGVSSDGILYFGFEVGGEDEPPEWLGLNDDDEPTDFDDFVCEKAGLPADAKYEKRSKVIESCPADLQRFCSYDYPMFILAVRGAEHRVSRGEAREITSDMLKVPADKIAAFKKWCEDNGIEYEEPKWLLCSMYG